MHIIYAATMCSDNTYYLLYKDIENKLGFHSQKYHRLMVEGLAANAPIDVVANPTINKSVMSKAIVRLEDETENGARYHYIPAIRNSLIKIICTGWGTFWKTLKLMKKDSAVIVDCLNITSSLSALLAARLRGRPCVGIVTDLPDMLGKNSLFAKVTNFTIRHCSHYVVLTEAMNEYLNHKKKPYVVLEGHADITMRNHLPALNRKTAPRMCFYAGGIKEVYGLKMLVEGFLKADIKDAKLCICGAGDYVDELKAIAEQNPQVSYGGILFSREVVEKEMEATLLINPRPTNEEYVKYSFPSKTMEYMSSGTPVLTTVLPGMPKEYHPYVFLLEDESVDGIAQALKEVLSLSAEELFEKGRAARDFVLEERNNVVQAKKILDMLY